MPSEPEKIPAFNHFSVYFLCARVLLWIPNCSLASTHALQHYEMCLVSCLFPKVMLDQSPVSMFWKLLQGWGSWLHQSIHVSVSQRVGHSSRMLAQHVWNSRMSPQSWSSEICTICPFPVPFDIICQQLPTLLYPMKPDLWPRVFSTLDTWHYHFTFTPSSHPLWKADLSWSWPTHVKPFLPVKGSVLLINCHYQLLFFSYSLALLESLDPQPLPLPQARLHLNINLSPYPLCLWSSVFRNTEDYPFSCPVSCTYIY